MTPKRSEERIPLFYSLRGKLIVLITLFVVFTALLLSANDYRYVRNMLRNSIEQQLQLTVEGLQGILLAYINQQQERAVLVASRTRLRDLMESFIDGELDEAAFLPQTTRILEDARNSTDSFLSISIAGIDGRIITSTEASLLGRSVIDESVFNSGLTEPTLGVPVEANDGFRAILSAPVVTNQGRPLGVVLVDVNVAAMADILHAMPTSFASYEVRVATYDNTRIRYLFPVGIHQSVMDVAAEEDPAMIAALKNEMEFDTFTAPDGRDLLVAYKNVGYRGWGLVAQIDAEEAYASITELRGFVALTALLVALLGIAVATAVARSFVAPITRLTRVAAKVGAGNLDARADELHRDEVGLLARAFNEMTAGLQRHQNELEALVKQRTEVLEHRTEQLQRSNDQLEELCRLLEDQAEVVELDLKRAAQIQRSLLPSTPPVLPGFRIHTLYRPGHSVGGDLYDVIAVDDQHVVLVVADASGHGVSAAMLAVLFKHHLSVTDETTGLPLQPARALRLLNEKLTADIPAPGVFFTCVYCLLNTRTRDLLIASAGHPPVLQLHEGNVQQIAHTGPALGLYHDALFNERTLHLADSDRLLLYTDGLFDIGSEKSANSNRVSDVFCKMTFEEGALENLLYTVSEGHEQEDRDDVTMLLLEASSGDSRFNENVDENVLAITRSEEVSRITWAGEEPIYYFCIAGRMTWTYGETLLAAATKLLNAGRRLIIDLSDCEYLDSTMLGTLHEVVRLADSSDGQVSLQGVHQSIKDAFGELSMDNVIAHLSSEAVEVPEARQELTMIDTDPRSQHSRLLKAHEELAALSDDNAVEFGDLLEGLRSESH